MKKVKKVFHSFKELQEEWQRQGIVKPDDERLKVSVSINNERIKNFRTYSNKVDEMFRLVSGDK
jgi:predicted nuclease with TOPRIM domain